MRWIARNSEITATLPLVNVNGVLLFYDLHQLTIDPKQLCSHWVRQYLPGKFATLCPITARPTRKETPDVTLNS